MHYVFLSEEDSKRFWDLANDLQMTDDELMAEFLMYAGEIRERFLGKSSAQFSDLR